MKSAALKKIQRGLFLGVTAAGMLATSGSANALLREINVDFTCTYPLIGTQPLNLDGSADVPLVFIVGEAIPPFEVTVTAMLQGLTWTGMNIVQGKTLEGDVLVPTTIDAVNRLEGFDVEAGFDAQPVPPTNGDFPLFITAFSPPLAAFTPDQVGEAGLSLDGTMDLMIIARKEDGTGVIFAESLDDTGVFPVICTAVPGAELSLGTSMVEEIVLPGEIEVSPLSINFGALIDGDESTETIIVSNVGLGDLTINEINQAGSAFSETNDCDVIAPGSTCEIDVTFTASGEGTFNGQVEITSTDEVEGTIIVPLTGSSEFETFPEIDVNPASIAFGTLVTGDSSTQTVTVSNLGTEALSVSNVTFVGGDAAEFMQSNDCGTVAVGDTCEIDVTYMASSLGSFSTTLTIDSNDEDEPTSNVAVTGASIPVPEPEIEVSTSAVDFGTVLAGETPMQTVTVANTGDAALTIDSVELMGDNAADFMQTNDCVSVAVGESCDIELTYFAAGDASHTTDLVIMSNDSSEPSTVVDVDGTSETLKFPNIVVSTASVDFGSILIGTAAGVTVDISNTGTAALTLSGISLSGDMEFSEANNCGTVAVAESCSVDLTFTASGVSTFTGTLTITSDDPDTASIAVSLLGEGFEVIIPDVDVSFNVMGDTLIAKGPGTAELSGTLDAALSESDGTLSADLGLDDTSATFPLIGTFLSTSVNMSFVQEGDISGTFGAGQVTADTEMFIHLDDIYLNIFSLSIRIGGGVDCATQDAVTMALASSAEETFDPLTSGGTLSAVYEMPKMENCGALTFITNSILAGEDNTVDLTLTQVSF